jgi:2-polyprenyl-3-methyl-5-hydroxy-6-metoxy-1,4-benzoquinol methylase
MKRSEATSQCPVCNRSGQLCVDIPDNTYGIRFSIHTCTACKVRYTYPVPSPDLLNRIYSGEYWARETTIRKKGRLACIVQTFSNIRLAITVRPLLKKLTPGMSILEVGCGSGHLAAHLKQCGFDLEVTDISSAILEEVEALHNIRGYCGNIEEIHFHRKYDAIIFNNVLEHLPSPVRALEIATGLLYNNGIIFIEVPNIDSLQFRIFKVNWFHLVIPQHLYHFSPESLDKIMQRFSFQKIWLSTFSPRTSAAGYAASLAPSLQPARLRQSWSKPKIFVYLILQIFAMPLVWFESFLGKGAVLRAMYKKTEPM